MNRPPQHAEKIRTDLGGGGRGAGCRPLGLVEDACPVIARDGTLREDFR